MGLIVAALPVPSEEEPKDKRQSFVLQVHPVQKKMDMRMPSWKSSDGDGSVWYDCVANIRLVGRVSWFTAQTQLRHWTYLRLLCENEQNET